MQARKNNSFCKALTKAGKHCRARATEGGLCYFHANPNKAVEMGRLGGRKSHCRLTNIGTLRPIANREQICEVIPRLFDEIYTGKLSPRAATALLGVLNLQFRAIEVVDVQRRVEAIEKVIGAALNLDEPDQTDDAASSSASSTNANASSSLN